MNDITTIVKMVKMTAMVMVMTPSSEHVLVFTSFPHLTLQSFPVKATQPTLTLPFLRTSSLRIDWSGYVPAIDEP